MGSAMRKHARKLRDHGFVDFGGGPPYFPPATGDFKKDPSTGEIRHIPSGFSLIRPRVPRDHSIQVDFFRLGNDGDYKVVATVAKREKVNRASVIFDKNGVPQDKEKARELETILFGAKR